jgi:hypothetical protein
MALNLKRKHGIIILNNLPMTFFQKNLTKCIFYLGYMYSTVQYVSFSTYEVMSSKGHAVLFATINGLNYH